MTKKTPVPADAADAPADEPTFEESLRRLEQIVAEMERDDLPLETAFQRFEEGTRLARLCQGKLTHVEKRLAELLDSGEERTVRLEPDA